MQELPLNKFTLQDLMPEEYLSEEKEDNIFDVDPYHYTLVEKARSYFDNLTPVIREYQRNRNFHVGDQFSDMVTDPETGQLIREDQLITKQGRIPIKNNRIQQINRNILGQFRDGDYKPVVQSRKKENTTTSEMMTNALHYVYDAEELREVDTRVFESYLLSALPGWKVEWGWNESLNKETILVNPININRLFFNTDIEDIRMRDLTMIGEIIDTTLEDVIKVFAKGNPEKEAQIKQVLGDKKYHENTVSALFDPSSLDSRSFDTPEEYEKVRLIEIWCKKTQTKVICHDWLTGKDYQHPMDPKEAWAMIDVENESRILEYASLGVPPEQVPLIEGEERAEDVWWQYILTPYGHCLYKQETPYIHESHPYVIRPFPMLDRTLIPFTSTMIDQQKYINRIIIMLDFMLGAGAKGVLMVPEEMVPSGMTPEEFAEKWVKFDSTIFYKAKDAPPGAKIEQIYSQSQSIAGEKMLALQMQLIKEVSGVTEAIQGQTPNAGTPSSLYAQMANYATLSSKDYFEHFANARKIRDRKIVSCIQQFWDEPMYINVTGKDYDSEAYMYDPEKAIDGEYDIVIGKSANSPMYRSLQEEYLMKFLEVQAIDFETFLNNTQLPFAQSLLRDIRGKSKEQQLAALAASPELSEIAAQADPSAVQMMQQSLR